MSLADYPRGYLVSGVVLIAAGAVSLILSARFVMGNPGFAGFYWSFYPVRTPFDGHMMVTGIPEVLLPWLIVGLAMVSVGIILLYNASMKRKKLSRSIGTS